MKVSLDNSNKQDFSGLNLAVGLLTNLATLDYHRMTPIQAQSLPDILAGRDVIGQAKTGSGKTVAFGLGLLQQLKSAEFTIQALVLCPTRELADQVSREIRRLARGVGNVKVLTLCGGSPLKRQVDSLAHGAHIIVGTPGRIDDHLRKASLSLSSLRVLVLDEADRMLDMGFEETVDAILKQTPDEKQTLLFSATYPPGISKMAERVLSNPIMVTAIDDAPASIDEILYKVPDGDDRTTSLITLLKHYSPGSTLVFCNTRRECQQVANKLSQTGFSALPLHGDLEQRVRDETLNRFANGSISILIATDVAARGLDIDALDAVINYQIANDLEVHTHRIGRTGRAGNSGLAFTLFSDQDSYKADLLERYLQRKIQRRSLPAASTAPPYKPAMETLQIGAGRKQKIRPGDILGALTNSGAIQGTAIGKIHIADQFSLVAVRRNEAEAALNILSEGKLKGRIVRARRLR